MEITSIEQWEEEKEQIIEDIKNIEYELGGMGFEEEVYFFKNLEERIREMNRYTSSDYGL